MRIQDYANLSSRSAFLLEIVMVSPVVHLEKNYEFQSRTIESQFKKRCPQSKTLGPLCNQTANLKTSSSSSSNLFNTVYTSTFQLKDRKRLKLLRIVKQQPQKSHEDILQKTFSNWSIDLGVLRDRCDQLFCVFGDFYVSGTQDAGVTKSLKVMLLWYK